MSHVTFSLSMLNVIVVPRIFLMNLIKIYKHGYKLYNIS
jgi:hypothetical protein